MFMLVQEQRKQAEGLRHMDAGLHRLAGLVKRLWEKIGDV
jgi:hypothetical protein